jgi:hypothetical protein
MDTTLSRRAGPTPRIPAALGAALYLFAIAAVVAVGAPDSAHVVIPLLVLSLAVGVVVARFPWALIPLVFFTALELTPWDYSFDETAGLVGMGALIAGVTLQRTVIRTGAGQASDSAVRRRQSGAGGRLLGRVVSRNTLDERIDLARLRLDSFPYGRYQPIAVLPGRLAKRADGTLSRWQAIEPVIRREGVSTAVDIGANEGFFSIELGSLGVTTIALEAAPTAHRTALLAVRRSKLDNVGVLAFEVREDTVGMIPPADATIFLSLWHHIVKAAGLDGATRITREIWDRTAKVMIFDTGENEMDASFGLPEMVPDGRTWVERYLADTCSDSRVEHLGTHAAFDAAGDPCERNLFAVVRVS